MRQTTWLIGLVALPLSACGVHPNQEETATSSEAVTASGLTVNVGGTGEGTVVGAYLRADGTITPLAPCQGPSCTYDLAPGTSVTLKGYEEPGSTFTGFQRPYCDVHPDVCTSGHEADPEFMPPKSAWSPERYVFAVSAGQVVNARFVPQPALSYPLTINLSNPGKATLTATQAFGGFTFKVDLPCKAVKGGAACTAPINARATVTLSSMEGNVAFQRLYCDVYPDLCSAAIAADPEWLPPAMYARPTEYAFMMTGPKTVLAVGK